MKIVAFSSIKGGTGKSSLCILAANHAAAAGYKVLVADLDLQNSTTCYYLDDPMVADRRHVARALKSGNLQDNIVMTNYMGVDLLASSMDLPDMRALPEQTLSAHLAHEKLDYDFLFIDTAPTYDNLVLNAIHAADTIITPVAFSQFDFKGALFYESRLRRDTSKVSAWKVLFNFYRPARTDNPEALRNQYEEMFRTTFTDRVVPFYIPECALVRRSIDTGEKVSKADSKVLLHTAIGQLASFCGANREAGRF